MEDYHVPNNRLLHLTKHIGGGLVSFIRSIQKWYHVLSQTTTRKSTFGTGHGWPLVPVLTTGTRHPGPNALAINTG